jgi:hypothetical protein
MALKGTAKTQLDIRNMRFGHNYLHEHNNFKKQMEKTNNQAKTQVSSDI